MRRFIPFAIPSGSPSTVQTQTKTATITTNGGSVTVQPDSGFLLSSATVTANIPTQSKTATITTNGGSKTVTPDSGKLLTSVKVTANIPTEEKTHPEITENGSYTITPTDGKLMTKATFSVNVPTGGGLPAWIREQCVLQFTPSSDTNEPLTVALSGLSGDPEIVIILTTLLSPTVTRSYGGGVYANRPNGIEKRSDADIFNGVAFIRQSSGAYSLGANGGITNYSLSSITITPPTYSGSGGSWIAGETYTIIALRTKTP